VVGAVANGGVAVLFVVLIVLWVVVVFGSIALFVIALVDIVRRPDWQWKIAHQEKTLWLLLVILVNFLGIPALIYWFKIRPKLIVVEKAAAAGHFGPGHLTYAGWEPTLSPPVGSLASPSWQSDPSGHHRWRWWDGRQWTGHVSDGTDVSAGK
jgi:Protein of unknown function (DUF2510)/Phospholipase_D-nuclease N-terminal